MTIVLLLLGLVLADPPASPEPVTVSGTAMTLGEAFKTRRIAADPDRSARQVVVRAADGSLTPLLEDDASRPLFDETSLRGRDISLTVRRWPGVPFAKVVAIRVREEGGWTSPAYVCDVCAIRSAVAKPCPCCQGPMDLRLVATDE